MLNGRCVSVQRAAEHPPVVRRTALSNMRIKLTAKLKSLSAFSLLAAYPPPVRLTLSAQNERCMSDTVKQSHLVPKCYLKNFAINNKIVAFNKLTNKILVNQNISEIATQNRFYDLNEEDINDLSEIIPNISKQYIENYLSRDVEPNLEKAIDKISSLKLDSLSKKYNITIKNEDKYIFNLFLVYQLFRTRKCREVLKKIIGKNNAEKLQKNILIDNLLLQNIARGLIDYEWILYINTTDIDYITSDNPVIIYGHL